jgi:hypothetical protein
MADQDALSNFDFDQFTGSGLFLKFKADKPVTVRVLTLDPVVSQTEFTDKKTGEVNLNSRFHFIVYNFTESKAQILGASPAMARKFGELHIDEDFGANIRNIDIKITPTGEGLERRYDIQVLPNTKTLTAEMIKDAQTIDLDKQVNDGKGRMSAWNQDMTGDKVGSGGSDKQMSGYEQAKAQAAMLGSSKQESVAEPDPIVEDIGDEPINLDDIPF